MADHNQVEALAGFMEAVQAACVDYGITLIESVPFEIAGGAGGEPVTGILWRQPDPKEDDPEDWHIEGTLV